MMLNFDYRQIDAYERVWWGNQRISDDHPSTLCWDPGALSATGE